MSSELGCLEGSRPVFLSGVYRSGTTILTQILGAHRQLAMMFDMVKFLRFCLYRYSPIDDPANRERLVRETHDRLAARWRVDFDVAGMNAHVQAAPPGYAGVYDALMRQLLGIAGDRRWGEKIAVMWSRIPEFLTMFPEGKVIHVLRDPRDATASYKKLTYEPGYTYLDCAMNCLSAMTAIAAFQQRFGKERVMWVRMEDLVCEPEAVSRGICDFLDLPYDPGMIDPARFRDKDGQAWRTNSIFEIEMEGISPDFQRWPEALTRAERVFVEMVTAGQMVAYGYEPDGSTPTRNDWDEIYGFLEDPFIRERFGHWLRTGAGCEGYRSDPISTELAAVAEWQRQRASVGR